MLKFKITTSFFISLLFLAGCSLPNPEKTSQVGIATFNAELKEASFSGVEEVDKLGVPTSKTLNLQACVTDQQHLKPIISHQFQIQGGHEELKLTSNSQGCLSWTEKLKYNHLTNSEYIKSYRQIIALGAHKGSRIVGLEVNPWESKAIVIPNVQLTNMPDGSQAEHKLMGHNEKGETQSAQLWIKNGFVNIRDTQLKQNAIVYSLDIQLEPKIKLKNSAGEEFFLALSKGEFATDVRLIHILNTSGKDERQVLASSAAEKATIASGFLNFVTALQLSEICTRGQLEVELHIQPTEKLRLQAFTGTYSLGNCDGLTGKQVLRLKSESENKSESTASKTRTEENMNSTQSVQIKVLPLSATALRYVNQSTQHHSRFFNVDFCLESAVDRRSYRAQTITVTKLDGSAIEARSLNNGCFRFEDKIDFNYFAPECLLHKKYHLQNDSLGLNQDIPVEINPLNDAGNFFQDLSAYNGKKEIGVDVCATGLTTMMTTGYILDKVRYSYKIDDSLQLHVVKTGILRMNLSLNRPSLSSSRGVDDKLLPPGHYKLKWAITDIKAESLEKAQGHIYSSGEVVTKLSSTSTITEEIPMDLSNIKAIGNTNFVFFEVTPADPEPANLPAKIKSVSFRGPLTLIKNGESNNLKMIEEEHYVTKLIQQHQKDKVTEDIQLKQKSSKEFFAKENQLRLVNLKAGQRLEGLDQNELSSLLAKNPNDLKLNEKLCRQIAFEVTGHKVTQRFYLSNPVLSACLGLIKKDVRQFFDLEYRYLVSKISAQQLSGSYRDFTISNNYQLSHGMQISDGSGYSIDASAGVKLPEIPGLSLFSASFGGRYTLKNHSVTESRQYGSALVLSSGLPTLVETVNMNIRAEQHEKCMVLRLNRAVLTAENLYRHMLNNSLSAEEKNKLLSFGYLVCNGEIQKKPLIFPESYYIITQKSQEAYSVDSLNDINRPFFVSLRGRADFVSFISLLHNNYDVPDSFKLDYQQSHLLMDPAQPIFMRGLRNYPGHLIAPK